MTCLIECNFQEDCSLTGKIVERVCGGFGRKLLSGIKGKLSYYDFLGALLRSNPSCSLLCSVSQTAVSALFIAV